MSSIQRQDNLLGLKGDAYDLVFTKQELATLRRATGIMRDARSKCRGRFGAGWIDSDADDALAWAEFGCADFNDQGRLEVWRA